MKKKILDVGCGNNKYKERGAKVYGIDKYKTSVVDKLWDGECDKIPYPDNFFDKVVSFEALEHIGNFKNVIEEIWRVTKPGGKVFIYLPYWRSYRAASEEHKTFFKIDSFNYLVPNNYGNWVYNARFKILKNNFQMVRDDKSKLRFLRFLNPIINHKYFKYVFREFFSHIIIPQGLDFELEVIK